MVAQTTCSNLLWPDSWSCLVTNWVKSSSSVAGITVANVWFGLLIGLAIIYLDLEMNKTKGKKTRLGWLSLLSIIWIAFVLFACWVKT